MTLPLCQQCGKKIYASYGRRGYLSTGDTRYNWHSFKTQEEYDAYQIPENAIDVRRGTPTDNEWSRGWYINYDTPQQPRDGLFHNRHCWETWHENHRDDLERLIKQRGEWKQ